MVIIDQRNEHDQLTTASSSWRADYDRRNETVGNTGNYSDNYIHVYDVVCVAPAYAVRTIVVKTCIMFFLYLSMFFII